MLLKFQNVSEGRQSWIVVYAYEYSLICVEVTMYYEVCYALSIK